jgi:excisionase family DNA binding protein
MSKINEPANKVWLRAAEVAAEMRVHVATVRHWIKTGTLPARYFSKRSVYVHRDDLDRFRRGSELI